MVGINIKLNCIFSTKMPLWHQVVTILIKQFYWKQIPSQFAHIFRQFLWTEKQWPPTYSLFGCMTLPWIARMQRKGPTAKTKTVLKSVWKIKQLEKQQSFQRAATFLALSWLFKIQEEVSKSYKWSRLKAALGCGKIWYPSQQKKPIIFEAIANDVSPSN